jgi:hypothetical protein
MDWRDSKMLDLEKTFRRVHFSNNNYKKAKIEKKILKARALFRHINSFCQIIFLFLSVGRFFGWQRDQQLQYQDRKIYCWWLTL